MPDKGEAGKIIQGDQNAEANYMSWNQAPDMTKLEIETLIRFIYSLSQTPDISFEAVKGLNDISGIALKMLFMDAHLKVKKKQRVFDAYLERRTNIIKAYIASFKTDYASDVKAIEIDAQIQPFMIDDIQSMIETLMTANGNQPLLSQKTTVGMSGLVDNAEKEYEQITSEAEANRNVDIFNPVNNPVPSDN
jgi:SPP1 family phage portal protein